MTHNKQKQIPPKKIAKKIKPPKEPILSLQRELIVKNREIDSLRASLQDPLVRLVSEISERLSSIESKIFELEADIKDLQNQVHHDSYH